MADPRPLTGEPLPLDLLNTAWVEDGGPRDLLAEDGGVATWLASRGLAAPADGRARAALVEAREALRALLTAPVDLAARERVNAVLARGAERVRLGPDGPVREVDVAETWRVPWQAATELVALRERHGDRIRRCANPECVLWFLDVSRPGTRRWCSMAACGNREKARRHATAA
ncbi:MAG: CGNR zinc finger domain-containing protein [Solirubrobacterales bacterium]|nr:CGNR zinc finger domain-containing protein [Solirubrobacterales bacterium]